MKNKGFTIIEVLLAAIMLAVGLVTVFSMANRAVFAHADLFASDLASRLADETLAQVKVKLGSLPDNITTIEGDFYDRMKNVTWRANISETSQPNLVSVTVTITRPGTLGNKQFRLATYMLR